jgi:hypothetical protein
MSLNWKAVFNLLEDFAEAKLELNQYATNVRKLFDETPKDSDPSSWD